MIAIEAATKEQSKCRLWHEERQWRITASRFGDVVRATSRRNMDLLCESIFRPKMLTKKAVLHGRKYEKLAIKKAEEHTGVSIQTCGLMIDEEMPFLAATPDGNTGEMLVEVKCPYKGRKEQIRKSAVYFPFLSKSSGSSITINKRHNYYAQIQGQLMIAKLKKCLFVIYTFVDFKCINVNYDHRYCEKVLRPALSAFYRKHYRPHVAKSLYL